MSEPLPRRALRKLREAAAPLAESRGPAPASFGKYRILREIGRGATGAVYEAEDSELRRRVALKILAPVSDQAARRFQREARVGAALSHPHLVKLHDAGEQEGRLYLVMELVEGRSFREVLADPDRTRRDHLELLEKAARGVAAAHAQGIVHRDLKPENILVDGAGEPKVGDFGLARPEVTDQRLTRTGTPLGTPLYMSPEQVAGNPRAVSPATDVFALGAILYEILAGRAPFAGRTVAEVFGRITDTPPETPREAGPELASICMKALQRRTTDRYPDAGAFADDLRRHLEGRPVGARPPSGRARWLLPAALVGVVAAAGALWWRPSSAPAPGPDPVASARDIDYAYAELCLRTVKAMETLEDRFHGVRSGADADATLAQIESAAAASNGRLRIGEAWTGLALVFAGRGDEGMVRIDRACASDPGDPMPELLRARAFLAKWARAAPLPALRVRHGGLEEDGFVESPDMAKWREEAAGSMDRALAMPVWSSLQQAAGHGECAEGVRLLAAKRAGEAADRFRRAGEASPILRDEAALLRGIALHLTGDYAGAAEAWEAARGRRWPRLRLGAATARICVGLKASRAGRDPEPDFARALAHLDAALEGAPADGRAFLYRAMLHDAWGRHLRERGVDPATKYAAALADWRRAREIATHSASVQGLWGSFLVTLAGEEELRGRPSPERWREAIEALDLAVKADSGRSAHRYNAGLAWQGLSRAGLDPSEAAAALDRARERFTEAIRLEPDYAMAWADRGVTEMMRAGLQGADAEGYRRAIADLDKSLELKPGQPKATHNRGAARLYLARLESSAALFEAALADFSSYLAADPRDPTARFARGLALEGLGRREEALREYEEVRVRHPKWPGLEDAIRRVSR